MFSGCESIFHDYDKLTLHWNDGLPQDDAELIQVLSMAVQSGIMSRFSALKLRGLSDEEVQAELEQIAEEQASAQPLQLGVVDNGTEDTD